MRPQGLTHHSSHSFSGSKNGSMANRSLQISMASKAMKLKLSGKVQSPLREVSPRKQVGDLEGMFSVQEGGDKEAWWRNVGMEEGM
jgi:hypothetical protein